MKKEFTFKDFFNSKLFLIKIKTIKNNFDFFNSKLFLIVLILILFFLSLSLFKELKKRNEKGRELISKKEEIMKLEEENKKIEEIVSSGGTDLLKEREARLKLGLKEPGENVMIIIKQAEGKTVDNTSNEEKIESNLIKWWKRFRMINDQL